ncbi:MAG: hypothetical protein LLG00_02595 [Planctomycetaceae bacterium]|nr:hypothetical protein [Planctomycetaceae bacterium]
MTPERIEQLKRQYTGKRLTVDGGRPELSRFADRPGRVVTVNHSGRTLVQFDGSDRSWYDIHPDFIKLEPSP